MGIVERLRNHDLLTSDDTELAADMLEYFLNGPYKSGHYDYTTHSDWYSARTGRAGIGYNHATGSTPEEAVLNAMKKIKEAK